MAAESRKGYYPAQLPDPFADEWTQPFWTAALDGKLTCAKCTNCGTFRMPPGEFCFECQHQAIEWVDLPGTATIYSFTVVRHPLRPDLAEVVPYVSGVVELDGTQGAGARMVVNIVDCDPETVRIGDKVEVVFEKVSDTFAQPRFRPVG
ncbi:MAG: Zn-ribbon domain-containing OB-fold protein [Acidimicrobiia bacterium]